MEPLFEKTEISIESDRILAQIVKIVSIEPIIGADKIEFAQVLGWEVVVKKEEFKIGDLVIYFNIGSILDKDFSETSFLRGKPLMTKKIRGVISQGLVGPLDWLKFYGADPSQFKEDDDVTKLLKVQKWIPRDEISLYDDQIWEDGTRGPFPKHIPKTQEGRVQNMSKKLHKFENKNIIITQKYDGTSTTYAVINNKFIICGRNNSLIKETTSTTHYFEIAKKYNLEERMLNFKKNIAIQGEIIGPKISGNRHKVSENEFYVFNIYDIDLGYYINYEEILKITSYLGLKMIKLVYSGMMKSEWLSVKALLELAESQKYETDQMAEGIVIKTDESIGYMRTSCKVISNKYLMKYNL
jgi:RNA ligase (TIGR02306 family)